MSELRFVWHAPKAADNVQKHGVTFDEAKTVFRDEHRVETYDTKHSEKEERLVVIGISEKLGLLMVFTTEVHEAIRIISARKANRREEAVYAGQVRR